jgi:predicted DNA-binding protein
MIRDLRINYIFLGEEDWQKLNLACDELGWTKSLIVKNCIHAFFRRYRDYYADAGLKDAEHRGMTEEDYFRTLRDKSEKDLERYKLGRPGFPPSPLDAIEPLPTTDEYKRKYNKIGLSAYNLVLLKVAHVVDGGSLVQLVSRIIVSHLNQNWEEIYQPQIDMDRRCKFR